MQRQCSPWLWVLALCAVAAAAARLHGEPRIEWHSDDVVQSRMTRYKYHFGPPYKKLKDPKAPNPGSNYGNAGLTVTDDPPRLLDRVLKRDAKVTGKVAAAPKDATAGRAWIEDNYARVIDQAELAAPNFAFRLDASRSLHTGLYLKAELKGGEKALWSGSQDLRMVPPDDDPWGDFILGVYNMGTAPGTGELWRQMGLSHRAVQTTNSPAFCVQNDLRFHASNIVYSLLGLYHRDHKRWREVRAAQGESRGPIGLARHRCLSDPKEQEFVRIILTAAALRFRPYKPLHYSIGDEIGIGDMASPHDLCASRWCLARYRKWLARRYGTVARLNEQWGTAYKHFEQAQMFSTWQALGRAKSGNFSPWADRLEFMDQVLYDAVARGVRIIRAIDPDARCNVSGVQQPSCWQFDHWLLANTVDCATPYEIGEGPDVLMSFYDDGGKGKIHSPGFGNSAEGLWRAFVRGYHLAAQWDSFGGKTYSRMIDIENHRLTPLGEKIKRFADWVHAGPGRLRNLARRRRDPVAILYSQPALRGNWILEMTARPDVHDRGDNWVTRGSWSVRQRELSFRVRVSWVQWAHDVGVWPKFVDARQLAGDYLRRNGFRVLILPRVVAMSDRTADAIRTFARSGGTVIADTWCGIMDEHCRLRGSGVLDDLFGVTRDDWRDVDVHKLPPDGKGVAIPAGWAGGGKTKGRLPFVAFEKTLRAAGRPGARGPDVLVRRKAGKGHAVYLNFRLESYFLHRLRPPMVEQARLLLSRLLRDAGVTPVVRVVAPDRRDLPFHPVGHDICCYRSGRGYLVGVRQNPTVMHSEVGGVETRYKQIEGNVFLKSHRAQLVMPEHLWGYDLTDGGEARGDVGAAEFRSDPLAGRFFALWPFSIDGVAATARVTPDRRLRIAGKVQTSAPVADEKLVVFLRVRRPDGSEQRGYRRTIDCRKGAFSVSLPLAANEHGDWSAVVREPCTGRSVRLKVRLP